jgi:hypothetical protein
MKFYLVIVLLILAACNDSNENVPGSETVHSENLDTIQRTTIGFTAGCYQRIDGNDTAFLDLQITDSAVTGRMVHKIEGMPLLESRLSGVIRDSLLIGENVFSSPEEPKRQIVFLVKDDKLITAYGKLSASGGKIVFTDLKNLKLDTTLTFSKVACPR